MKPDWLLSSNHDRIAVLITRNSLQAMSKKQHYPPYDRSVIAGATSHGWRRSDQIKQKGCLSGSDASAKTILAISGSVDIFLGCRISFQLLPGYTDHLRWVPSSPIWSIAMDPISIYAITAGGVFVTLFLVSRRPYLRQFLDIILVYISQHLTVLFLRRYCFAGLWTWRQFLNSSIILSSVERRLTLR